MVTCAGRSDPSLSIYCSFDNVKNNVVKGGSKYKNDGEVVGGAKFNNGKVGKAIELKQEVWVKINDAEFKNLPKDGFTLVTWLITKIQEMRKVYLMLSATNMGAVCSTSRFVQQGFNFSIETTVRLRCLISILGQLSTVKFGITLQALTMEKPERLPLMLMEKEPTKPRGPKRSWQLTGK